MESISKSFAIAVFILLATTWCIAQKKVHKQWDNIRIKESGFLLGAGYGLDTFNLPEGNYTPLFCIARLGIDFKNKNLAIKKPHTIIKMWGLKFVKLIFNYSFY